MLLVGCGDDDDECVVRLGRRCHHGIHRESAVTTDGTAATTSTPPGAPRGGDGHGPGGQRPHPAMPRHAASRRRSTSSRPSPTPPRRRSRPTSARWPTGYSDFVKVLADANYNPASGQAPSPEVQAKIEAATEKLDTSDFQEAADRVTAWFQAGCKS